jgi:hypothetical protein
MKKIGIIILPYMIKAKIYINGNYEIVELYRILTGKGLQLLPLSRNIKYKEDNIC